MWGLLIEHPRHKAGNCKVIHTRFATKEKVAPVHSVLQGLQIPSSKTFLLGLGMATLALQVIGLLNFLAGLSSNETSNRPWRYMEKSLDDVWKPILVQPTAATKIQYR